MFRPGVSPNPGGKPRGGRVVKRKARKLREAARVVEIINEGKPRFEGDGVDLLIATYQDPTVPLEIRLTCAREAAQYERSKRSPTDAPPGGSSLETLVMMSAEGRLERAEALIARARIIAAKPDKLLIEAPATPAPAKMQESIRRTEAESL